MADLIENTESQVEDNSILGIRDSEDKFRKKYEIKDVYTTAEKAEARAQEMGGEGSHEHIHMVDDKKIVLYMPFPSHEEYLEAVKEKEEVEEDKEMPVEENAITAGDVHSKKPIGTYDANLNCDCEEAKPECDCEKTETTARKHAVEQTFNLNGVEIFSTGIWNGDRYNEKDLDNMVSNFDDVGFEPPVKIGHNEEQPELKDGQPALGYVDKIYTVGSKLLADFKELPKKVYEAIKRGNYKRVSSEIYWNYRADDKSFNRVLKAVALLGAEIPAVTNLESITGLYKKEVGTGDVKLHYNGKESEIMEETHENLVPVEEHEKALEDLRLEKEEVIKEFAMHKQELKKQQIATYMKELKDEGKVLPAYSNEVEALLSTATDEKVYKFSQEDKEVELSQFELVQKIFSNLPKVVEFAELSETDTKNYEVVDYDNAGAEVDRRVKIYLDKELAKDYATAMELVLKEDKELKEKHENV